MSLKPARCTEGGRCEKYRSGLRKKDPKCIGILVVDDQPEIVNAHRRRLSLEHNVRTARNGEEALQMIRRSPPDLVVTDFIMPEMDGMTLATKIREEFPGIKVILYTTLVSEVSSVGVLAVCSKKDPETLYSLIEAYAMGLITK